MQKIVYRTLFSRGKNTRVVACKFSITVRKEFPVFFVKKTSSIIFPRFFQNGHAAVGNKDTCDVA